MVFEIEDDKMLNLDNEDQLTEMRFFYHFSNEDEQSAEKIAEEIRRDLNIEDSSGNMVCILPDLPFVIPRGKYSADFCKNGIKLHGSSYNFTIKYSNISKTFLLPINDNSSFLFVIGFSKPLKQGQTVYNYMAIQFRQDSTIDLDLTGK